MLRILATPCLIPPRFPLRREFMLSTARLASDAKQSTARPVPVRPDLSASPMFSDLEDASVTEARADGGGVSTLSTAASRASPTVAPKLTVSTGNIRYSHKKLRFLASQIVNLPVSNAIAQMQFSAKKPSRRVLNTLALARSNARLQQGMDIDRLVVAEAWVGKGLYSKGIRYHGRGRSGLMMRPKAHMKIVLKEKPVEEDQGRGKKRGVKNGWKDTGKVWMQLQESRPIYNPKPYYNWW